MLDFRPIRKEIPDASGVKGTGSTGAVEFGGTATFNSRVKKADAAIQTFKLDQADKNRVLPVDLVQVGVKEVKINGNKVNVVIKTDYSLKPAAKYTGEVIVLVIADVA
jgi:hypothetical protein